MKNRITRTVISTIFVLNSTILLFGQERIVQGRITTFDSIPVVNASIEVKSSGEVVFSDTLGMFAVTSLPRDKLKVKATGFSNRSIKIKENIKFVLLNLKLKPGPENLELAIGYGHVRDSEKLYAVSSLYDNDMDFSNYDDIYDIIEGSFPGVQVINGEIVIRGGKSSYYGNTGALLVVDGLEVDEGFFSSIPPVDVARISVLKGPAASIYGVKAANGVVIVETKGGRDH